MIFFTQRPEFFKYLVGYYKFDGNVRDSANAASDLNAIPNPAYSAGKLGLGFDFNSTNMSGQALRNNGTKYTFTNGTNDLPFCFSFWMIYRGGSTDFRCIFGRNAIGSSIASPNSEYQLLITTGHKLSLSKYSMGMLANNATITTVESVPLDTLIHVVLTDDALGNTLIYFNGIQKATVGASMGSGFARFTTGAEARQGFGNSLGVPTPSSRVFYGLLDDFAIFKNYILKPDDIAWIYNSGNGKELK